MRARSAGFSGTNDKKPQLSHRSDFTYFADPDIPQNPASELPYGRRRFKFPHVDLFDEIMPLRQGRSHPGGLLGGFGG